MSQGGSPTSNVIYDLVSIQYHALKGAQVYEQFLKDASGQDDVRQFIERVRDEDAQRAKTCHELLAKLTKDGFEAYPSESSSKQKTKA